MSSNDDNQDDSTDATQDIPTRETNQGTRDQRTGQRPGTTSRQRSATTGRASIWGAGLIFLFGLWIIIAAFFWGDPVGADEVVATELNGPAVSEATGEVVAVEAAAIEGASNLYWSNIIVGIIIVIIAIILIAAAGGYLSDQ